MRLNGWQRIGVVASVLWMITAALWVRNDEAKTEGQIFRANLEACIEGAPADYPACFQRAKEELEANYGPDAETGVNILLASLVPVAVAWLLAAVGLRVFRWIRAGFAAPEA